MGLSSPLVQGRLAVVAEDQLIKPGVLLIGTTRRNGSARISGVEPCR